MTPSPIADFMASLFVNWSGTLRLLDPGAGLGSLTEAFIDLFAKRATPKSHLLVDCYEVESRLADHLTAHLAEAGLAVTAAGHEFVTTVHREDFIERGSFLATMGGPRFTHAILNPPYRKISTDSGHRKMLREVGIETVNLYTAFLGLTIALMEPGGEIVAIIPRSFCNGPYFRPFRHYLLDRTALTHLHVFTSRTRAFHADDVLQENIIVRLVSGASQGAVTVSGSQDATFSDFTTREVAFEEIVRPDDEQRFIHIPVVEPTDSTDFVGYTLEEIGLEVSTGPVVDFRVRDHWLSEPVGDCAPLLYTHHFRGGALEWPRAHKKPNALALNAETRKWLMPAGYYALTKRFSTKEERRRLVAYLVDPQALPYKMYGFENHLNVFHFGKGGLLPDLAKGICLFLNSSRVDEQFRIFSGHTQVNATDLRTMRYPSRDHLIRLGARFHAAKTQSEIDSAVADMHG